MIAWEAAIVSLVASAAGVVPGAVLGNALARGFVRHGIAPRGLHGYGQPARRSGSHRERRHRRALRGARRRTSRIPGRTDTRARRCRRRAAPDRPRQADRRRDRNRGRSSAFSVSAVTHNPQTAAATSELNALFLVAAVGFLGPIVARIAAEMLRPVLSAISPVGGFLAAANLRAATRRFSSASTPLVLSVALSCTLLFSSTTSRPRGQRPAERRPARGSRRHGLQRRAAARGSRRRACDAGRELGGGTHADDARPRRRRPLRRRDFGAGAGRRRGRRPRRRRGRGLARRASRHDRRAEPNACRRRATRTSATAFR